MPSPQLAPQTSSSQRQLWIDRAKGIGISLVVLGHVLLGLYPANLSQQDAILYHTYLTIYSFHMPLFFFLSGLFVDKWRRRPFFKAILQKANSLLRPYLIWSLLFAIFLFIFGQFANNEHAINILTLPIQPSSHFWFLYVLFFVYLLYYGLAKIFRNTQMILLVSFLIFMLSPYLHFWVLSQISFHLLFLSLGSWYATKAARMKASFSPKLTCLCILFFCVASYLTQSQLITNTQITQLLCALLGILCCIQISHLPVKIFARLGELSLAIYVVHPLFTAGSRTILKHIGFIAENQIVLILLCFLAGIVGSACIFYAAKIAKIQSYIY